MATPQTIYETTTKEGTHVQVMEDLNVPKDNPIITTAQAIAKGVPPSNEQITGALHTAKQVLEEERLTNPNIGPQGSLLSMDAQKVIESAERLLKEKNVDESFQQIVKEGQQALQETKMPHGGSMKGQELSVEAQQFYESVKNLVLYMIRSGEFRDIGVDMIDFFQTLLSVTKDKVVEEEPKIQEKLEKKKGELKGEESPLEKKKSKFSSEDIRGKVNEDVKPMDISKKGRYEWKEEGWKREDIKEEVKEKGKELKENIKEKGEEVKEEVRKRWEEGPQTPEEQKIKDELVEKLTKLLRRIGSKQEYKEAVNHLFNIHDTISSWMTSIANSQELNVIEYHQRNALNAAKRVLGRFTGEEELHLFQQNFWALWLDFNNDPEVQEYFVNLRSFFVDTLQNPEKFTEEDQRECASEFVDHGRYLFNKGEYKQRWNDLWSQGKVLLDNMKNDAATTDFQTKLQRFSEDFAMRGGKPDIFVLSDSIGQLQYLMGPLLKKYLATIPVDIVEIQTKDMDFRMDGISFSGIDLLPSHMDFRMDNKLHLDFSQETKSVLRTRLVLLAENITPSFEHVKFQYRRKVFPKIDDYGAADLAFKGKGARIKLVWQIESMEGMIPQVRLLKSRCTIDKIDIHIIGAETKHNWFDKIMAGMMEQKIKTWIANSIEQYLRSNINPLNEKLMDFFRNRPLEQFKRQTQEVIDHGSVSPMVQ